MNKSVSLSIWRRVGLPAVQEDFLVLEGECIAIIEGEERRPEPEADAGWDADARRRGSTRLDLPGAEGRPRARLPSGLRRNGQSRR